MRRKRQREKLENGNNVTKVLPDVTKRYTEIEKEIDIETETETEKEIEVEQSKTPYQLIVDMYNDTCVSFPRVKSLSDMRKAAIRARLKRYTIEDFRDLFTLAESSDFLKGANAKNWSATFDWLIKDSNFAKVLDGNYNDARDVGNSSLNNVDEFVNAALSRGFEDLVVDGWNKKEQPKTAADDESIKARAEALKQQFAGK
jgi:hypothetical protein